MLDEIKEYLKVLDEDEDNYLNSLILQGEAYLNNLAGVKLNFNLNTSAKTLLKDYCRYAYNNATEFFETNFNSDILRLQLESAVIESANKKTSNEKAIPSIK